MIKLQKNNKKHIYVSNVSTESVNSTPAVSLRLLSNKSLNCVFIYLIKFHFISEAIKKKWASMAHSKTTLVDVVLLCRRCSQTLRRTPKSFEPKVKLETRKKSEQPKSFLCAAV